MEAENRHAFVPSAVADRLFVQLGRLGAALLLGAFLGDVGELVALDGARAGLVGLKGALDAIHGLLECGVALVLRLRTLRQYVQGPDVCGVVRIGQGSMQGRAGQGDVRSG